MCVLPGHYQDPVAPGVACEDRMRSVLPPPEVTPHLRRVSSRVRAPKACLPCTSLCGSTREHGTQTQVCVVPGFSVPVSPLRWARAGVSLWDSRAPPHRTNTWGVHEDATWPQLIGAQQALIPVGLLKGAGGCWTQKPKDVNSEVE